MIQFFARATADAPPQPELPTGYRVEYWRPRGATWRPAGMPWMPAAFWTVLHHLRAFSNPDYGMVLIRRGDAIAHHLLVTPRWYRFPFMAAGDVQIGAVATNPAHRGLGLAKAGIAAACRTWDAPGRRVWYLVEPDNIPSIRAATACGFSLVGQGRKRPRFGTPALGQYVLTGDADMDGAQ